RPSRYGGRSKPFSRKLGSFSWLDVVEVFSLRLRPFCLSRNLAPNLRNDVDWSLEVSGVRMFTWPTMSRSFAKLIAGSWELKLDSATSSFCGLAWTLSGSIDVGVTFGA